MENNKVRLRGAGPRRYSSKNEKIVRTLRGIAWAGSRDRDKEEERGLAVTGSEGGGARGAGEGVRKGSNVKRQDIIPSGTASSRALTATILN